jgi:predicted nucleic acid-binding protein
MTPRKGIVIDANILIRAAFGIRVRSLLKSHSDRIAIYCREICLVEARRYVTALAPSRGLDQAESLGILDWLASIVEIVDATLYQPHEADARARISARDPDDWPIVAASLLLNCPVWTEDQDFFGSGIATWTTQNIELFLRNA